MNKETHPAGSIPTDRLEKYYEFGFQYYVAGRCAVLPCSSLSLATFFITLYRDAFEGCTFRPRRQKEAA
jgi:hypothetical protein